MLENKENSIEELFLLLEQHVKNYRVLLTLVRNEKEILIRSDLEELGENNKNKEDLVLKIRSLEIQRERTVQSLYQEYGLSTKELSLLQISNELPKEQGNKLRGYQGTLQILIKRIQEVNQENESLIQSALANISGAMTSIKETLNENKTNYQNQGRIEKNTAATGRLVSKEI